MVGASCVGYVGGFSLGRFSSRMSPPGTEFYWDNPRKVGSKVTTSDGSVYYRGPGSGTSTFIAHSRLKSRNFLKGDDAFFLFSLEGAETQAGLSARLHPL